MFSFKNTAKIMALSPSCLSILENEAIYILREAAFGFQNPVLLYSGGKDSSVLLHLARKAFAPHAIPFPLLHIDTGWKFTEMIAFRDEQVKRFGLNLLIHTNKDVRFTPFDIDPDIYTRTMKTDALKQALSLYCFDAAIGGARRDEEKSRAKERVFSVRGEDQSWNPRAQRPEVWNIYNTGLAAGETMRVFPLSNWTETDIWSYIAAEEIGVVSLYFAAPRKVVQRAGRFIMIDDARFPLQKGEVPQEKIVRFRTLGCYPLSAAVESKATNVTSILAELNLYESSERAGRLIDRGAAGAMERKKREGYF